MSSLDQLILEWQRGGRGLPAVLPAAEPGAQRFVSIDDMSPADLATIALQNGAN